MARKRRTKTSAKTNSRRKSDSDQNSNGLSDGSEGVSKQESGSEDRNEILEVHDDDDDDSKTDSYSDESHYNPYAEKNHKHPKFRYLERRHSSSNEEDSEYNTCDLMPQQIQDIVLGDVKAVIISQDDIANDTCLQGHIEHEEVIGNSMECEVNEVVFFTSSEACEPSKSDTKEPEPGNSKTVVKNSDFVKAFEINVQINENVKIASANEVSESTDVPKGESTACAKNPPVEESKYECNSEVITIEDSSSLPDSKEPLGEYRKIEEVKKHDVEKKKSKSDESGRRRSSRIRVNRWTDDEVKSPAPPEVPAAPPPPPLTLFDSDKPVKVKSRWRRTSELEMGGTSSGSLLSDSEVRGTTPVPMTSPDLQPADPRVEEGLKSFEIISHNIFLTPRGPKKERLVCECTLTKEEIAKGDFGCGDDCLNRLLMIECGSRCSLGNLCSNRQFQNCQYTPCQVIKTKKKGLGLITTVNVGPGTFLMEYVGEVLESKEFRRRAKEYAKEKNAHYYFMQLESSHVIDATVKGNISRFINHSCDPNSETQKWTVNGELRIGFFSKKAISAGEEITFDYKLDRYGREAQKCYCEAANCRGWIGENPDAEKEREKSSKKEKKEKKREKKKELLSDREMEYEVEKLVGSGVKNQKHTLTLSRLMVRAEDESSRRQLLEVARGADVRCLRLFLDYHGLGLLWSYMVDSHSSSDLKLDILNTLAVLPISNRTVLQDSKVLNVVRKWAKKEDASVSSKDRNHESGEDSISPPTDTPERIDKERTEKDEELENKIVEKSNDLLTTWDNLKHEYRIPKKERIEQMKEHEREANRGYSDPWETKSNERHWNYDKDSRSYDKESRNYDKESRYNRDRKRGRESPESDWRKSRMQDERQNGGVSRMSKTERRQLFALKVEEEDRQRKLEEDRQRMLEEDWAKQHAAHMLGPPPSGPLPPLEPGYFQQPPPFHPPPDGGEMVYGSCPPAFPPPFLGPPQTGGPPPFLDGPPPAFPPQGGPPAPGGFHPPPYSHPPMAPAYQPPLPQYPPFPFNPPPQQGFPPTPGLAAPSLPAPSLPAPSLPSTASLPPTQTPVISGILASGPPPPPPPLPHVFPIKLPPKWRSAKDKEGRIYYYHTKTRKSQWQIPTEETAQNVSDTESDSDDSTEDDESSSDEEEDEKEEEEFDYGFEEEEEPVKKDDDDIYIPEEMKFEDVPIPNSISSLPSALKKRREGLVEINIISPRDGEDDYRCGITKKQIREKKEARAREKRRLRNSGAAKCVADSSMSRLAPKQKVKVFRAQMANEIVALLNPYRKADCKTARITTTEDFKFLARKLTHFVTLKELRHCASPDELVYNDKVRHKAKDFVRKYMAKFGYLYRKSTDD